MNAVKKKLNSSRGASAVIALVFFVVAAVVGAVVLSSASANASRVTHTLKDQQDYYAVESALKLFEGKILGKTVSLRKSELGASHPATDSLDKLMTKYDIYDLLNEPSEPVVKTIKIAADKNNIPGLSAVTGILTIKYSDSGNLTDAESRLTALADDQLEATFELFSGDSDDRSNCVTAVFRPIVTTKNEYKIVNGVAEGEAVAEVSWYQYSMEKGVSASDD